MNESQREDLEARIRQLEAEVDRLRAHVRWPVDGDTVRVPETFRPVFDVAQKTVGEYFSQTTFDPTHATIKISGERYVLLRASSLSFDFLSTIKNLYADHGEAEAFAIGRSFLFDISHVIGMEDAKNFHKKMGVTDPLAKLSAGPVHFAYSGWAFVDISPDGTPSPDENFFLKFDHPFSFEADAWLNAGERSDRPVCIMNAGYSSGWCEQSFGIPLTAVEISCKAAGDDSCTFIMAPPSQIKKHLSRYLPENRQSTDVAYDIPSFFERKRVEEEMKTARQKAEESDRMKSEFLANMSHEIRTPMNAVIGMTELVLDSQLTDVQREYLNTTLESAESLMAIINQILDFSKIEAGKLELEALPFSLRECISDTMKSLALRAQNKHLDLVWQVAPDVPDELRGDQGRLRQIIVNLIGNAIKFTDQGEIVANVGMEQPANDKSAKLHVQIRDTGIGVPEEKREAIFDAFTQVDMSTTRRYGGTGLGLTISAELVRLMGGRIWVDSQKEPGSTFHFTAEFEIGEPVTTDHSDFSDLPVLVVAEKESNRKILEEIFSNLGMRVGSVDSAPAALHGLIKQQEAGHPLRLLIIDLVAGVSLVESVRRHSELDPVTIALISGSRRLDVHKYEKLAVDACLMKPVKQSELLTAIVRAQKRHEERKQAAIIRAEKLHPQESPEPSEEELAAVESQSTTAEPGIRILLVEDGVANQKFAVAMLSRWGHDVTIANNGKEAVNLVRDGLSDFDLVLMDVLMPEMDGLEATTKIRQLEEGTASRLPIVAITAQAMKGDREKCLAVGMDGYLTKPIRRRELQDAIQKLLG